MERTTTAQPKGPQAPHELDDAAFQPAPGSAVRPRIPRPFAPREPLAAATATTTNEDGEITATRFLADLRPAKLFDPPSWLIDDGGPDDDTEEEIVTSVIRSRCRANDIQPHDDDNIADEEIIDVVVLPRVITPPRKPAQNVANSTDLVPDTPPVSTSLERQERTVFLEATLRRRAQSLGRRRTSHVMDDEARAALKARLEEVAAAVRRREIDFGASPHAQQQLQMPALMREQPPNGGWPKLPWAPPAVVQAPHHETQAQTSSVIHPRRNIRRATRPNAAVAGAFVLLLAGVLIMLSAMRPKTYGSTCTFLCIR